MTPIERAIAALGDVIMKTDGGSCHMAGWFDREELDGIVRVVIAAIREPSEGMVSDGAFQIFRGERITEDDLASARRVWRGMHKRLLADAP
jgi:hypothetical protein